MRNIIVYTIVNRTIDVLANNPEARRRLFSPFRRRKNEDEENPQSSLVQGIVPAGQAQLPDTADSTQLIAGIELEEGPNPESTKAKDILDDIEFFD